MGQPYFVDASGNIALKVALSPNFSGAVSSVDPTSCIPVRLSDGIAFYTASFGLPFVTASISNLPAVQTVTGSVKLSEAPAVSVLGMATKQQAFSFASASAGNIVVSGVLGKRIKVFAFSVQSTTGTVGAKLADDLGNPMMGRFTFGPREGLAMAVSSPAFLFATVTGSALVLDTDSSASVAGFVSYWDTDAV